MLGIIEIVALALLVLIVYVAACERGVMGVSVAQSVFLAILRLAFRLRRDNLAQLVEERGPTLYIVLRQSWLDAAFLLTILPRDVDHIYAENDQRRVWLAPFRWLARNSGNWGLTLTARVDAAL